MTFEEYIERLAIRHKLVRHRPEDENGGNGECHFSALVEEGQNSYAHRMHYPCVVVDGGDFDVTGDSAQPLVSDDYSLLFLIHVTDPGNRNEVLQAFALTRTILMDFLKKMLRDKQTQSYPFLNRFTVVGCAGHRVFFQDASLYGWVLHLNFDTAFNAIDCNNAFD